MFAVLPEIDEQGVLTFTPGTEPGLATVTVTAKDDGGLHEWTTGSPWSDPPDDTSDPVTFQIVVLPNEAPFATDDQATVTEDTPTPVDVLANDGDWDGTGWDAPLTITGASGGTLGTPELVGSSVVYTPDPDATGDDTFTYTIQDADGHPASGTVHVTITPVNDDPVATDDTLTTAHGAGPATIDVLANDSDVDGDTLAVDGVGTAAHGTAALASGTVTYQPDPGYSGADTFDYGVADGHGGSATASVRVTVTANQAPSASDDALTVDEDVAGVVDVLANDSDAGGSKLSITGVTNGLRGSAALVDGGVAFTPSQDANGPD
jgi:hypothetical protein